MHLEPDFHTCVSRTHNGARCLMMYGHQWSQAIPAFATEPCEIATKSHMLNFYEVLRGLCRDMLWLWPMGTNNAMKQKIFFVFRKKFKVDNKKKITTTFRKSLFLIKYRMRYAIHLPSNTKTTCNKPKNGCLWKPANRNSSAGTINSDSLRSLEHLILCCDQQ